MPEQETFKGYVCWDEEEIDRIFEIDAGNIEDHILEAVHTPASISLNEKSITEDDVYKRLVDIDGQQGYKIMPIFGLNGSGKSHLVRRLHQRVKKMDKSLVVYVKRSGLSLKSMVESILDELERDLKEDTIDEINALREQLKTAHEVLPIEQAMRDEKVLNNVASELQKMAGDPNAHEALKNSTEDVSRSEGQILAIIEEYTQRLPMLLRAEAFRKPLTKEGGVVDRFVKSAIETAENFDPEDSDSDGSGFTFTENDLPSQADARGLGDEESQVFQDFDVDPDTKSIVASIISTAFIASSEETFGLKGDTDLGKVFRDVRKVLKSKNFTLYVLIEELSQMQAYASAFLDSFIENPEGELCDIHVAIAVTEAFYNRFASDTFKDRVKNVNDGGQFIYVHSSSNPEDNTVLKFASNYLNAVRVGNDLLKASYPNGTPNRCDDCPHREVCHVTFGQIDDKGLYPFNSNSLHNFYSHVTQSREELNNQFNPRAFTRNVVREVLVGARDEIISSNFPNKERTNLFTDSPQLNGGLLNKAVQQDTDNSGRRIELLRFWSGQNHTKLDLSPGIHEAFNLPLLEDGNGLQQINASVHLTENKTIKIQCEQIPNTTLQLIRHNLTDNKKEEIKNPFNDTEYIDDSVEEGKTYRYEIGSTPKTNDGNLQKYSSHEIAITTIAPPPSEETELEIAVQKWNGAGTRLTRSQRNQITDALYDSVIKRIDWPNLGIPNPPSKDHENCLHPMGQSGNKGVLNPQSFHLTKTAGETQGNSTIFTKKITPEDNGNEIYLLAKARSRNGLSSLTTDERIQLLDFLDSIASEIQTELIKISNPENSYMKALLERIALAALCSDNLDLDNSDEDIDSLYLAQKVFGGIAETNRPNTDSNTPKWSALIANLYEKLDPSIAYVIDHNQTVTSGYSDSRTPRIGRVAILLEDLAKSWSPVETPNANDVGPHKVNRLTKNNLDSAIDSELETYLEEIKDLSQLLVMSPSWIELGLRLDDIFTKSIRFQIVDGLELSEIQKAKTNLTQDSNRREVDYYVNLNEAIGTNTNTSIEKKLQTLSALKTGNDVEIYSDLRLICDSLTKILENAAQVLPDGPEGDDPSPSRSLVTSIDDFIGKIDNER